MKVFTKKQELIDELLKSKALDKSIGFVPTMGALHKGHLSLIKKAKQKNDIVVASIFVNPTQFDNKEDLVNYPKTLQKDYELLISANCDIAFAPNEKEVYGDDIVAGIYDFDGLENEMEGKFRTGHFNGVGTIVRTLFEIVKPDNAYFGEKDFQQLQIIKKLVKKYDFPIKIKGCKIYREADGLAMSSRNKRLTDTQRKAAPFIYKILKKVKKKFKTEEVDEIYKWVEKKFKKHSILQLEYFTIAEEKTLKPIETKESDKKYRGFIAVFAGNIRLIDNIRLKNS